MREQNGAYSIMNKLNQLPSLMVFTEVARRNSFTQAAQELGLSKSAVSQHVRRLEDQMGGQLLSRNTRGMTLTTLGEKLLAKGVHLRGEVDHAFRDIEEEGWASTGEMSITFPYLLEERVVIPALRELRSEFPGVSVRAVATETPLDLIEDKLDVAIYAGALPDSSYRASVVGTVTDLFCASAQYVEEHGAPETFEQLERYDWIVPQWQRAPIAYYEDTASNGSSAGTIDKGRLRIVARCTAMSSAVELVRQGVGVSLLPDFLVKNRIESGELVRLFEGYRGDIWPFHFVHAYERKKPAHVARFQDLIRRIFSQIQTR